jgi:hypothetical protein
MACTVKNCPDLCQGFYAGDSTHVCLCGHKINQHASLLPPPAPVPEIKKHPHSAQWAEYFKDKLTGCAEGVVSAKHQQLLPGLLDGWVTDELTQHVNSTPEDIVSNFIEYCTSHGYSPRQAALAKIKNTAKFVTKVLSASSNDASSKSTASSRLATSKPAQEPAKKKRKKTDTPTVKSEDLVEAADDYTHGSAACEDEGIEGDDDEGEDGVEDRSNKPWTDSERDAVIQFMTVVTDNKKFSSQTRTVIGSKALELAHADNKLLARNSGDAVAKTEYRLRMGFGNAVGALNKARVNGTWTKPTEPPSGSTETEVDAFNEAMDAYTVKRTQIITTHMKKYASSFDRCDIAWGSKILGNPTLFSPGKSTAADAGNESIADKRKRQRKEKAEQTQDKADEKSQKFLTAALSASYDKQAILLKEAFQPSAADEKMAAAFAGLAQSLAQPNRGKATELDMEKAREARANAALVRVKTE